MAFMRFAAKEGAGKSDDSHRRVYSLDVEAAVQIAEILNIVIPRGRRSGRTEQARRSAGKSRRSSPCEAEEAPKGCSSQGQVDSKLANTARDSLR